MEPALLAVLLGTKHLLATACSTVPLPLGEAGRRPGEGAGAMAQIPGTLTLALSQRERE
jgi:hypothetical protein